MKNKQKKASTIFKTRSGPHNLNSALSFLDSSFFAPKPQGNACYAGYGQANSGVTGCPERTKI